MIFFLGYVSVKGGLALQDGIKLMTLSVFIFTNIKINYFQATMS